MKKIPGPLAPPAKMKIKSSVIYWRRISTSFVMSSTTRLINPFSSEDNPFKHSTTTWKKKQVGNELMIVTNCQRRRREKNRDQTKCPLGNRACRDHNDYDFYADHAIIM